MEYVRISVQRKSGKSLNCIAVEVGRPKSTISKCLKGIEGGGQINRSRKLCGGPIVATQRDKRKLRAIVMSQRISSAQIYSQLWPR